MRTERQLKSNQRKSASKLTTAMVPLMWNAWTQSWPTNPLLTRGTTTSRCLFDKTTLQTTHCSHDTRLGSLSIRPWARNAFVHFLSLYGYWMGLQATDPLFTFLNVLQLKTETSEINFNLNTEKCLYSSSWKGDVMCTLRELCWN